MPRVGRLIRVHGRVQGVGFRPFVWRLAREAGLHGTVRNDGAGVRIEAWGPDPALKSFIARMKNDPPPLARIDTIDWTALDGKAPRAGFRIEHSGGGTISTEVAPDAAPCADCLAEIRDPVNRRFRYPFTNCTNCGPRMSIVVRIPYDRSNTTMRAFEMCEACRSEYENPADRRFHAQPNACPECGPRLWLEGSEGAIACDDPILEAARRLRGGAILAIKGIGGFHLACDAMNEDAVHELRRRKHRPAKPLAVMARDVEQIGRICTVSAEEQRLLLSPAAPIVLLRNKTGSGLGGIAPGLGVTGVMLPNSPLHHLLMEALDDPIVLTSGNVSGSPQIIDNARAREHLSAMADAWLMHDRDIVNRLDDSVTRIDLGAPVTLRRGRGLSPEALALNEAFAGAAATLALGGELKSTFCLLKEGKAYPSQHIGDLTSGETFADLHSTIDLFRGLFRFDPKVIAVDLHPDHLSTRLGRRLADEESLRLVEVQHHHAHFASCLAENGISPDDDRAVGIILDGTGFGLDGTIWGGEILVGGYTYFERVAHLEPVALPGGEQAVREPWRNTVSHLRSALGPEWQGNLVGTVLCDRLVSKPVDLVTRMIESGLNSPLSSSTGRLFDAVAAALGIAFDRQHYEGQAAMELETIAGPRMSSAGAYPVGFDDGMIALGPLWRALVRDLKAGVSPSHISARFHNGLATVFAQGASAIASEAGVSRVVLSGGVMQNRLLLGGLHSILKSEGLEVLLQRKVPANDGGLALGQAAVAAMR